MGTYRARSAVGQRLTSALPTLAVLPGFAERSSLFGLLGEEIAKDDPGQDVVLDRLLDLLLVDALRAWFASPESAAPRWYRARDDPAIGPALRLLVDNPSHGGRSRRSRPRPGCRGRRSRGGSPSSWASRR